MVAPVSRVAIVLGRIAGGVTTALIQGILILVIALFMGFKIANVGSFCWQYYLCFLLALVLLDLE